MKLQKLFVEKRFIIVAALLLTCGISFGADEKEDQTVKEDGKTASEDAKAQQIAIKQLNSFSYTNNTIVVQNNILLSPPKEEDKISPEMRRLLKMGEGRLPSCSTLWTSKASI